MIDKEKVTDELESEFYRASQGQTGFIETFPAGDTGYGGIAWNASGVELIFLSEDAFAYRHTSDSEDQEWQIGCLEDTINEAISFQEAISAADED